MRNSIWRRTDGQTQGQVQVLSCAFAAKKLDLDLKMSTKKAQWPFFKLHFWVGFEFVLIFFGLRIGILNEHDNTVFQAFLSQCSSTSYIYNIHSNNIQPGIPIYIPGKKSNSTIIFVHLIMFVQCVLMTLTMKQ